MKKGILLSVLLLVVTGVAQAIPNPAAVYCILQGYEYEIRTDEQGNQYGVCVFPDGSECGGWDYYCKCEPNGITCWPGDFTCHWPCKEMRCKEAGESVLVSKCCEGLDEIYPAHIFDANCNKLELVGWLFLCSDCGNGICESWESKCNCSGDCAQPRIIYVDDDGFVDFNNIQEAINDANDGDTIIVQPGRYTENINFLGKNITLTSTNPTNSNIVSSTTIDGVVHFRGTEDLCCTLTGFNIDGFILGFDYPYGQNHTHATISHCLLCGNTICCTAIENCDGTISNCLIADNYNICDCISAVVNGCHGLIKNCTIVNGDPAVGVLDSSATTIENCIIYRGPGIYPQITVGSGATLNISYSDVQSGLEGIELKDPCNCTVNWGPGNIDIDPCFVRVGDWFGELNGDYRLKSQAGRWDPNQNNWVYDANTSPCIDAGNPGCPLSDEPNDPNNTRINMGAYGGTAEASKSPANWRSIADLTNDWTVDFNDLKVFVDYWLETGECIPSDLNRSQAVDFVDFAIFARQGRENNYILLEIYSDGWGGLLETATMKEEGQITILVYEEEPYNYPPAMYYVYASRDGYYTEIYYCEASGSPPNNFITVDVDLDPIVSGKFTGVIFMTQSFFSDRYLPNTDVTVKEGETVVTEFQTDQQGRFATEIEPGNYDFEFISDWQEYHLEPVSIGGEYQDFFFPANIMVLKPNIYLYPEETIELDVDIVFPSGGRVTQSVPDYNDGWHITVEPSGIIDGQFECLFYESLQPDYGQYAAGWVVIREQLEGFFRNNMGQTGFNQKEIDDFIEYWIPILTEYPYYAIYPQYRGELEEMVKLEFSAQPESLIRLIYSVRGLEDNNLNIQEPVIPPFTRDGFTVTEWGVILK